MRPRTAALLMLTSIAALQACEGAATPPPSRVVDLGHALAETDPSWTGEKVFIHSAAATFAKDNYFAARFSTDEHFGTHVDAPAHFAADGLTVDRIPADRLVRPGVCINVSGEVLLNDDFRVPLVTIKGFESRLGAIAEGSIVLIATGWDSRWPDAARYMNARDGVKHFPGLSVEAATYLARDRKVAAIVIDTPSIDYGPSSAFEAHRTTMPAGIYHVENAANLTSLPPSGFTVIVAPIKIAGGSGGPTRIFALLQ